MPVPTDAEPLRPRRVLLKDMVHDQLRDAILDRTLRHGEVLSDDELARWLGASRNPIRAAIHELAQEGLIETWPNRYTRVAVPSQAAVISATHALGALYAGAMRFTVPTLPDRVVKQSVERCADVLDALASGDVADIRRSFIPLFDDLLANCANDLYRERVQSSLGGLLFIAQAESVLRAMGGEPGLRRLEDSIEALGRALSMRDTAAARAAVEDAFLGWIPDV
ncbi:GntR family transcriptional regulator [Leifsonia aquatica]|uniref:GntR family transcriptional regulator n=1 Tax=Leifsonia aquatica TaxID=144185 RepID=UPI00046A8EC9|nr:GntR family transcriptional regulator [Leifsonia aquatica]